MAIDLDLTKRKTPELPKTKQKLDEKLKPSSVKENKSKYKPLYPWEKPTTNLQQSTNKPTALSTTNLQQSTNKPTTKNKQKSETYNKVPTQPTTLSTTNLQQSTNKPTTKSYFSLVGVQQKIMHYFFTICRQTGSRTIEKITTSNIAENAQTTVRSAKETIRRLRKANLLTIKNFKNGRGGWCSYELPEKVYQDIFKLETYNKVPTNLQQSTNTTYNKVPTQPTTTPPSSSSGKKITTTTNNMPVDNFSDASWKKIQIPMFLQEAGLNYSHVQKIYEAIGIKFEIEQIQESLDQFAYDLVNKLLKARTSPLNFLMGVMVKNKSLYVSESQIEALRDDLKSHQGRIVELEQAKAQFEELEQQNLFEQWLETLSLQKRNEIVPPNNFIKENSNIQQALLKDFWKKHVQS